MPTATLTFAAVAEEERIQRDRYLARQRAEHLLVSCLSPAQKRTYTRFGCFYLRGACGTRWRIEHGAVGNVHEVTERGRILATYCAHPVGQPIADVMLTQKLWLEGGLVAEFRRVANCHWRRAPQRSRRQIASHAARVRWGWTGCLACGRFSPPSHAHERTAPVIPSPWIGGIANTYAYSLSTTMSINTWNTASTGAITTYYTRGVNIT